MTGPTAGRRRTRAERVRRPVSLPGWGLAAVCGLCLVLAAYVLVLSGLQQHATQGRLYDQVREQAALGTAPLGATTPGRPVALLQVPDAGLRDVVVVEGTSSRQTQDGPGHRRDTALPGQPGVSVLYGRGLSAGGPFRRIGTLQVGDRITLTTGQGTFRYTVSGVRRQGSAVPKALAQGGSRLTLVSEEFSSLREGLVPRGQVLVDATMHGATKTPDRLRPSVIAPSEQAQAGYGGALFPLVLWLRLLLLAVCATAWVAVRWRPGQAWLVAAPALTALLWLCLSNASLLLPNLF
ncbi:sortase [Angustibacter aerolatus]|uniref:Sortase n=1 Tax=Angustibacter aerolatus TaxID=1162965 RepID=A0ABQ6JER2_9ACTN|nr:class E sortase [Angustibacter aerolatus]GMA86697.1 sortase [Angustibacter aerolatus]